MPENQEPARRLGQDDPLRGEFTDGKALTDDEIKRAGISREGTLGSIGYRIGRDAGETVISNLRNGTIDERQALWIACYAPGNDKVQAAGIRRAIEGASKGEILARMQVEQAKQNLQNDMGISGGQDLFGFALENEEFDTFAAQYINRKRNGLATDISYLNKLVGKKLSKEQAKKYGIDIKDPEGLRKALDKLRLEQAGWLNPWERPKLTKEIREAWEKEHPPVDGSGELTDSKSGKDSSDSTVGGGAGGASMSVTEAKRGDKEPPVFKMLDLYHKGDLRGGGASFSVTEARERFEKEIRGIRERAQADGTYMKAPNGEETNLTEAQWAAVRTEAFKNWFGDWERDPENASKVVDENGEPMVVYHGSYADFKEFDVSLAGKNFGTEEEDAGFIFTTSSRETAENYSEGALEFENERRIAYGDEALPDESARNYELFVNLENPLIYDLKDNPFGVFREGEAIEPMIWDDSVFHRKALKEFAEGDKDGYDYDGIILKGKESVWVLATEPEQIKSATENRGTYDSRSANISFSVTEAKAHGFHEPR